MQNPNFRPFSDADRANEQAWRASEFWIVTRRLANIIFFLSVSMVALEVINTVISHHFEWGRCYSGVGLYAGVAGILTALIGIVALAVPWRRRIWIFSYFPFLILTTIIVHAVMIMSIYCFVGIVKMENKTGNYWRWNSIVVGTSNIILVIIGFTMVAICIASMFIIPCLLPLGRYRELEISGSRPPSVTRDTEKETEELRTVFISRHVVSGAFVRTPLAGVQV